MNKSVELFYIPSSKEPFFFALGKKSPRLSDVLGHVASLESSLLVFHMYCAEAIWDFQVVPIHYYPRLQIKRTSCHNKPAPIPLSTGQGHVLAVLRKVLWYSPAYTYLTSVPHTSSKTDPSRTQHKAGPKNWEVCSVQLAKNIALHWRQKQSAMQSRTVFLPRAATHRRLRPSASV